MSIVNAAHFDDNQQASLTGVIGTLGTADVTGTAPTLPVGVNPLTGAMYVQDLAGASGTTNIAGTVTVSGGTINAGSVQVLGGTINVGTVVNNGGTAGTVTGVGVVTTVSNLTNGTIRVTAGTMNVGTINSGTINAGTINTGTFVANGGTQGLFNARTGKTMEWVGTTVSGTIGTLVVAPTGGSSRWVTSLDVSNYAGTSEVAIAFGLAATGNGILFRGQLGAQGGVAKSFLPACNGGTTNTAITWNILTGSGTFSVNIGYFTEI